MTNIQSILTPEENLWFDKLKTPLYDQEHLLDESSPEGLKKLLGQIINADSSYPGGLLNYLQRARKLLKDSKHGVNTFEGYCPEVPLGANLETGSAEFNEFENLGLEELNGLAFVLVAGGLGERLGYPGIKVSLPVESITGMCYLEYYIRVILACEVAAEKKLGARPNLPLCIMTSNDTHKATEDLLRENNCFGFPSSQLVLVKQEKVPALLDNEAHMAVKSNDRYILETKPHGHGDVHSLLHRNGLPSKWLSEGRKWMIMFQDTNTLVAHAIMPLLGVSNKLGLTMNSLAVARRPGEAVGAICQLQKPNTTPLTINVEYSMLDPLLKSQGGDVADPNTGYSRFPGNTNILMFNLERYADILHTTGGTVPEFVNPKYADSSKSTFKSASRMECMMQDLPQVFTPDDKVGFTQLCRWLCFSAVKNNVADAAVKSKGGIPAECAFTGATGIKKCYLFFTGESDLYFANSKLLEIAAQEKCSSVDIAKPVPTSYLGVQYRLGPRVVMMPSFALGLCQVKNRLKGGKLFIGGESGLILEGDVQIEGLTVTGGLTLKARQGHLLQVKNLSISNAGYDFVRLESGNKRAPTCDLIRGYEVKEIEVAQIYT